MPGKASVWPLSAGLGKVVLTYWTASLGDVGLEHLGVGHAADDRSAGADGEQDDDDQERDARAAGDARARRRIGVGARRVG